MNIKALPWFLLLGGTTGFLNPQENDGKDVLQEPYQLLHSKIEELEKKQERTEATEALLLSHIADLMQRVEKVEGDVEARLSDEQDKSEPMSLQEPSSEPLSLPEPRVVILGATGVGKSTLANVLLGLSPADDNCENCEFPACSGGNPCTNTTSYGVGKWLGTGNLLTVIDTPGFGDSGNNDTALISEMMDALKNNIGETNLFLLSFNAEESRIDSKLQQMIREMEALFGKLFWDNTAIEFTHWKYDLSNICERNNTGKTEEWKTWDINQQLQEKFHIERNLSAVFVDSFSQQEWNLGDSLQQEAYARETSKLWDIMSELPPFAFKTIEDILEDLYQCESDREYLNNIIDANLTDLGQRVHELEEDGITTTQNIARNLHFIQNTQEVIKVLQEEDQKLNAIDVLLQEEDQKLHDMDGLLQEKDQTLENRISQDEIKINSLEVTLNGKIEEIEDTFNGKIETIETRGRKSSVCGWREDLYSDLYPGGDTITYDTVHTEVDEVNSVLDANTGIYTAGVTGVYEISLSGIAAIDPDIHAAVRIEGTGYGNEEVDFIFSENSSLNGGVIRDAAAATRHVTLTAGQQISLKYEYSGFAYFGRIKFCVTLY